MKFDTPLLPGSDEPLDLDPTGEGLMETFTFLYLSSEDCRDAIHNAEAQGLTGEAVHDTELSPDNHTTEEEKRKPATTHINVTSDEMYKSTGEARRNGYPLVRMRSRISLPLGRATIRQALYPP